MIRYIPLLLLSSCMALSPDAGMNKLAEFGDAQKITTQDRRDAANELTKNLLKKPLTQESVVQIALLNHRGLQASFNELGMTEAILVQSTLPSNPIFTLSQIGNNATVEVERTLLFNVISLLTLNQRIDIAQTKLKAAQLKAVDEVLKTASEARKAYINAASSKKLVSFLEDTHNSAKITSRLFVRLGEAGAVNKLDQAREHVYTAEIAGKLAQARLNHKANIEKLTRALGLFENNQFTLHPLPPLPSKIPSLHHIEQDAVSRRVDLAIARLEVDIAAMQAGLTKTTRYMNLLDVKGFDIQERNLVANEHIRRSGIEIELILPIFDWGQARSVESKERYLQAVNNLYAKAVIVRSQAREAHARYQGSFEIAGHYTRHILPLRAVIKVEQMLRYNAMLIDILPVLAENRQRIASNIEAIMALKEFHLATSDIKTVVIGGGVSTQSGEVSVAPVASKEGH